MDPYANCVVYGPYLRIKDGRKHVICIFPNKSRRTVSYPKYLVEKALGRLLTGHEEVHHINKNFKDNSLTNLAIVDKRNHMSLHAREYVSQDFLCPVCKTAFVLQSKELNDLIRNRRIGRSKTGPFCSRSCAGIGSDVCSELNEVYVSLLSPQEVIPVEQIANSEEPLVDGNSELG